MSSPVTFIRGEDLLDESASRRLARSSGSVFGANSPGWRSRRCCSRW